MKYTTLPNTEIKVSKICLGTHDFGEQNTEAEGHEQMDYALEHGTNFLIQLMYSVPAREETYGSNEKFLEPGLKNRKKGKLFWHQNWRS
jgi:aryl-alcohol dehydrogenase-like predicted oxidoreductase